MTNEKTNSRHTTERLRNLTSAQVTHHSALRMLKKNISEEITAFQIRGEQKIILTEMKLYTSLEQGKMERRTI